ncbi:MAG: sugar ABC transporter permease [Actinomycetota bacterium]|nr:MAG: sugar ABC transporter permease [Actinomycetota bacterium]
MDEVVVPPVTLEVARRGGPERLPGEPRRVAYLFLAPAFLIYAAFTLVPLLHAVNLSFFDWDGLTPGTFVGLRNYEAFFTDPLIRSSYGHTLVLIVFFSFLPITIGLVLAASLSRIRIHGLTFFRTILFLPVIITNVVVAVTWAWIYAPDGPLNALLRAIGLGHLARAWLGDFTWALPAVGLVGTWGEFGFCMILFIAGIMKIPASLYEAARVDGAGPVREFLAVTLPGLRHELTVALVLTVIDALGTFDLVYVMTSGGPGTATSVPAFQVYSRAFLTNQVGSAAAIGITLMLIVFAVTFGITRLMEREER